MSMEMVATHVAEDLQIADVENVIEQGCEWLRTRLAKAGKERLVIGLSGGIDSAVAALWAARAIGAENLTLLAMPYGLYTPPALNHGRSTKDSVEHAKLVAEKLPGAEFLIQDIAHVADAEIWDSGLYKEWTLNPDSPEIQIALGNVKARLRAVRLRGFANRRNALLLGTENLSELMLGYFTLGGDDESDLEIIEHFYKTQVYQLAHALGVPEPIINKPPSADLWEGQSDEGELGFSYQDADQVLRLAQAAPEFEGEIPGVDAAIAKRVIQRVRATQFKRDPKPVFVPNL